jgi:hypothetical protein
MKRRAPVIAVILGVVSVAWSAPPVPLTSLHAVHALSNSDAATGLPVAFEATVTYYRGYENTLFVQDGDAAMYVAKHTRRQVTETAAQRSDSGPSRQDNG